MRRISSGSEVKRCLGPIRAREPYLRLALKRLRWLRGPKRLCKTHRREMVARGGPGMWDKRR